MNQLVDYLIDRHPTLCWAVTVAVVAAVVVLLARAI